MLPVFGKACIGHHLVQIMALRTHRVGAVHAEVGTRIQVGDRQSGRHSLAELVAALQYVRPFRPVRTIRAGATKLAIVIAIVAIGAEDASTHRTPHSNAIKLKHLGTQAWLR